MIDLFDNNHHSFIDYNFKSDFNLGGLLKYFLSEDAKLSYTLMATFMARLNGHSTDVSIEAFETVKNEYKIKNSDLDFKQLVLFGQKKNEVVVTYLLGLGIDLTKEQQEEFPDAYNFIKKIKNKLNLFNND